MPPTAADVSRPDTPPVRSPELVVVGAASRDRVADDPRGWRLGGTATYASLAAAALGVRVGCLLGVDADAADARELRVLEEAGVELRRVPLSRGPIFENIEHDGHRRQRWMSTSGLVPVEALPPEWRGARAWLLGPVAGEIGSDWAGAPAPDSLVCVGWQGLLRRFDSDGWVVKVPPASSPLLERADIACASFDDLPAGYEIADLRGLAPRASLVLTAGAEGGISLREGHAYRYRAFPADVVDATGAGDVFMAGMIAAYVLTLELLTPKALALASAAGACAVEGLGLAGVPTATKVRARLRGGPVPR